MKKFVKSYRVSSDLRVIQEENGIKKILFKKIFSFSKINVILRRFKVGMKRTKLTQVILTKNF